MRGGSRAGSGRKKGGKNRPRLQLVGAPPSSAGSSATRASQRMNELKNDIALFHACGLTITEIAVVLEIDADAALALFQRELENAGPLARAQNLTRLRRSADKGSVGAQKALHTLISTPRASESDGAVPDVAESDLNQRAIARMTGRIIN